MSKPKNMTPEQEAAWAEARKAYKAAYRKANADKIRQYNAEYRAANPEKAKAWTAKYIAENAEKVRETRIKTAARPERKAYMKNYADQNKAVLNDRKKQWAKTNPDKVLSTIRTYYAKNKEDFLVRSHKRRQVERESGQMSRGIYQRLMAVQRGLCAVCRSDLKEAGRHLDHIMPLALGGTNTDDNAQLLCPPCNLSKHAKHPVDFMQQRGYLL